MFRSLFHDHLQGSSFILSAFTTFQLPASSFIFFGYVAYAIYLYVSGVPVCVLSGRALRDQTAHRQLATPDTHTKRWHTATYPKKTKDEAGS
jgi:hypothetical protein